MLRGMMNRNGGHRRSPLRKTLFKKKRFILTKVQIYMLTYTLIVIIHFYSSLSAFLLFSNVKDGEHNRHSLLQGKSIQKFNQIQEVVSF